MRLHVALIPINIQYGFLVCVCVCVCVFVCIQVCIHRAQI